MGPKKQDFWPRIDIFKRFLKNLSMKNYLRRSLFLDSSTTLFSKIMPNFWWTVIYRRILFFFVFKYVHSWPKILLFRTHHLWNSTTELILLNELFFDNIQLIFEIKKFTFKKDFPLSMFILGQKSCFLGPTIFEIPQPNWH